MKNMVQKMGVLAFALIAFSVVAAPNAMAVSTSVGIEPAYSIEGNRRSENIFIFTLKANEEGANGVKITNTADKEHSLELYTTDSFPSMDGSFSCKQKVEKVSAVGTWVKLAETKIKISAKTTKIVDFTVSVPKSTGPGEHNGCIIAQDYENLPAKSGSGVLLGFRSALRVSVTVPGKIIKKLLLQRVDVARNEAGDYVVSPVAKNTGNVSLDVKSYARLESIFNQKTELKNDAMCPVMPGATMACPYTFERPYWGGIYKARTSLKYNNDPKDGIGENTNESVRLARDSDWFLATPDPMAALAEVGMLTALLWIIIAPIRRHARRKRLKKTWEKHTVKTGETLATLAAARGVKWQLLAKMNRLKAPYLLEVGDIIIVPKLGVGVGKKTKKDRKKRSAVDWLDEETSQDSSDEWLVADVNPTEQEDVSDVSKKEVLRMTETEVKPVSQPPHSPQESRIAPHTTHSAPTEWVSPRENTYAPDEELVDWREGANSDELEKLEGIEGLTAVPKIKSPWDSDAPTREKLTKLSKKPSPKRRK